MFKFFGRLFSKRATKRGPNDRKRYKLGRSIGSGTFGTVFEAEDRATGKAVAIKKIPDSPKTRARQELQLNLEVSPFDVQNIVKLLGYYCDKRVSPRVKPDLCLVFEHAGNSLKDYIDGLNKKNRLMEFGLIKVYTFQMFRGLQYLHSRRIIHCDVKPSNLLINCSTNVLKISDLGIATRLREGLARDVNVCSGPYRAPELTLGNEDYTEKIDIWSAACIFAECHTNVRIFPTGSDAVLYRAMRELLGDPTIAEIREMQPLLKDPKQAGQLASKLDQRFARTMVPSALALLKSALTYSPSSRLSAIELCAAEFYDRMRESPLNEDGILYNFADVELADVSFDLIERVIPPRCRDAHIVKQLVQHLDPSKSIAGAKSTKSIASTSCKTAQGKSAQSAARWPSSDQTVSQSASSTRPATSGDASSESA